MLLDEEERAVPFLDGRHRAQQGASKLVHERRLASRPDALLRSILLDSYTGDRSHSKGCRVTAVTVGSDQPHRERAPPELDDLDLLVDVGRVEQPWLHVGAAPA
jgi:hypothetical protein